MSSDKTSGHHHLSHVQEDGSKRQVDPRLLEFLVCPLTRSTLSYDAARQELISHQARLAFPIRNGVPLMTVDSARHLDDPTPSDR